MRNTTYASMTALGMALLLTGMASCSKDKKKGAEMETPTISVAYPVKDSVTLHKTYPGTIYANDMVTVVARVNGTLLTKQYKSGDRVTKGQVLFTIEDTKYRDAVTQAKAQLATAESQLDYARRRHAAMKQALQSDAVSQMDVTQAEANLIQAQAAVEEARAALSTANTNLGYCVVRAPITGHIAGAKLDIGSYIGGEGNPVELTTIYNDDVMQAVFSIEDAQYQELVSRAGGISNSLYRDVPLEFKTKLNRAYTVNLTYAAPAVSSTTGTVTLKGNVENPDKELRDGMYVTISLPYATAPDALLVRDASIGTDQLGKYVYVVNDSNRVVYTPIKVGEVVNDSLRIVTEGLKESDRYVTKALLTVRTGMEVKPEVSSK